MGELWEKFHVDYENPVDPPGVLFNPTINAFVFNRLLHVCDEFHVSIDAYVQKAIIAQLKKDKQWF